MPQIEIDAVRALLSSKPRPIGWPARRKRLDDVGAVWPVAPDVEVTAIDLVTNETIIRTAEFTVKPAPAKALVPLRPSLF